MSELPPLQYLQSWAEPLSHKGNSCHISGWQPWHWTWRVLTVRLFTLSWKMPQCMLKVSLPQLPFEILSVNIKNRIGDEGQPWWKSNTHCKHVWLLKALFHRSIIAPVYISSSLPWLNAGRESRPWIWLKCQTVCKNFLETKKKSFPVDFLNSSSTWDFGGIHTVDAADLQVS